MPATCPLSLIVPCHNPGARLHETLGSVWAQRRVALQLIVVDGGSTDGTLAWLSAAPGAIETLLTGPDDGIYDAMNKGVAAARGDWVMFLGADDRLVGENVLSEALHWAGHTDAGVIAGEAAYDDGRIYRFRAPVRPIRRNFVHHQAALYRRGLFAEHGGFDTSLRVAADYDFNLRLWKARVRFKPMPLRLAACGTGGASDGGAWRVYREEIAVRHRYFSAARAAGWDAVAMLRFLRKQVVRTVARR